MQHRIVARTRLCVAVVAATVVMVLSLSSTQLAAAVPAPLALRTLAPLPSRAAVDPVGSYDWSLVMASMDNTPISGTLTVTRKDSALAATLTSDHTDGELQASSVKLDGNRLTVVSNGDFGEFTVNIEFKDDSLDATFHFVAQDGSAADGPMTIKRSAK
jgi:hypothetical protein